VTRDTGASEPVGTLYAIVLDVNDLESCLGFWSEVLGKETSFKADKYCRIGGDDSENRGQSLNSELYPHMVRYSIFDRLIFDATLDFSGPARNLPFQVL
jgi:hypothetical protein